MNYGRRNFLSYAGGSAVLGASLANPLWAADNNTKIKAIAFDAFPIFDPRPAFKVIKEQFPNQGDALRKLWFNKIFGYTWLRTAGNRYKDFWHVMEDALHFAAASMELELTDAKKVTIMEAFLHLPIWPDVKATLEEMRTQNIRLAFLSNMTEAMLRANMRHNNIEDFFEFVLSTDQARMFKPSPKAYQLGVDAFGLKKEEIAFAAFAGWDATGANWFGYPSVWVNRLNFPAEKLNGPPTIVGRDLNILTKFIQSHNRNQ